jgi:hypothetical protein
MRRRVVRRSLGVRTLVIAMLVVAVGGTFIAAFLLQ